MAEFARIDALEERPPDAAELAFDFSLRGDPRRFSRCYAVRSAAARAAVVDDELHRGPATLAADETIPAFGPAFDIPPAAVMFGALDPSLVPPASVSAARARADYRAPHGWHAAMAKEIKRVEGFRAWSLVPMSNYWDDTRTYPGRTSIG